MCGHSMHIHAKLSSDPWSIFWHQALSKSLHCICEKQGLWRDCAYAQACQSPRCSPMKVPNSHTLGNVDLRVECRLLRVCSAIVMSTCRANSMTLPGQSISQIEKKHK